MSLIYCYGIVKENPELDKMGFESKGIYTIPFQDIFAVVSNVSEDNFSQQVIDKNVKNMKWLAEHAQIHEGQLIRPGPTTLGLKYAKDCTILC